MKASIKVWRYDPEHGASGRLVSYQVPYQEGDTVLQALLNLYEYEEPIAFRYGCRFNKCGLCALEVNGRPRLACRTPLKEGMVLRPLRALPNIRDLVIDRKPAFATLLPFQPWLAFEDLPDRLPRLSDPQEHQRLMACTECLGCLSTCPAYRYDDPSSGGPFHFVKLAQMHFHPLDRLDRAAQARSLSIERCAGCLKCRCLVGIPIVKMAILPLLEGAPKP
ncbi:MAG: 2Fe-2S iron-sulfur cluster-binding protein [Dehalococcoidia bacterium]|nr:2Fe-2S iron-sulfur cluster-binding protein [Dehalococcoidia bacterium]